MKSMEKKTVFVFSDGVDITGIVFESLDAVEEWIKADVEELTDEELKDLEYTINVARMTHEEIDNLPEADF